MFLIHFKSRDLDRILAQGRFWHVFFTAGSVIISQDEVEAWTVHIPVPLDTHIHQIDPYEAIYSALGDHGDPNKIQIDEILVNSSWQPNVAVADNYRSKGVRLFLCWRLR